MAKHHLEVSHGRVQCSSCVCLRLSIGNFSYEKAHSNLSSALVCNMIFFYKDTTGHVLSSACLSMDWTITHFCKITTEQNNASGLRNS